MNTPDAPPPLQSMTGAASAAVQSPLGSLEGEVRSVNHRFLKVTVRQQTPILGAEEMVETEARRRLRRGHVSVTLRWRPASAGTRLGIEEGALMEAAESLRVLAARAGLPPPTLSDLARIVPFVLDRPGLEGAPSEAMAVLVNDLAGQLMTGLIASRAREGLLLEAELARLLDAMGASRNACLGRAALVPELWKSRFAERLTSLLAETNVQLETRDLAREAALFAERTDVREELARLEAHILHARALLERGGAVGRELDFLSQEMHREVNTLGAKAQDAELAREVVAVKATIEQLREQVQNLE